MVSVEDETLVGGGKVLKSQVWNAVKEGKSEESIML